MAEEGAVFFRLPPSAEPYHTYAKLRFGRVFFGPNSITVTTTDFNHHTKGNALIESFKLVWQTGLPLAVPQYKGPVLKTENHIQQGEHGPITLRHDGYAGFSSTLGTTGITQQWLTRDDHLAFDLKGPGRADWSKATFKIEGIAASLADEGIQLTGKLGQVLLTAPETRIKVHGVWQLIPSSFRRSSDGAFGFSLPRDAFLADSIWIDPRLVFSGYSGSLADNWGCTATYDRSGNTFVASMAFDMGFPVTTGCYQNYYASTGNTSISTDVGIQKFSPDGSVLMACTYLGGRTVEVPHSIVCTHSGELVVFGTTGSNNFPVTTGSYSTHFSGGTTVNPFAQNFNIIYPFGSDLFITKLNGSLTAVEVSTYLGGTGNDGINTCGNGDNLANYGDQFRGSVDVDAIGNIYLGGVTHSANFPVVNGFQNAYSGNAEGIICVLNPGLQLTYSTMVGGNGTDAINSITLDAQGRIGFCGVTSSINLPTTANAYQRRPANPATSGLLRDRDAFAGIVTPLTGRNPDFLSYSSTSSYDQAFFADFDSQNRLWILGQSTGDMPHNAAATAGNAHGGLFIQRFNTNGSNLDFAMRFGSRNDLLNISPTAFQIDICGQIYFSGWGGDIEQGSLTGCDYLSTFTTGLPVTPGAIRSTTDGQDFYVCILLPDGEGVKYATFMGADSPSVEHVDGGTSRFDPNGYIYQAVCAGCGGTSDFPHTASVYSETNRSDNCNSAAFKMDLTPLYIRVAAAATPLTICPGEAFTLTHNAKPFSGAYIDFGLGIHSPLYASPLQFAYDLAGTYTITVVGESPGCPNIDSAKVRVVVKEGVERLRDTTALYCLGDTIALQEPATHDQIRWYPAIFLSSDTVYDPLAVPLYNQSYNVKLINRSSGCADSTTVNLRARTIPITPTDSLQLDSCAGMARIFLRAEGDADTTQWKLGNSTYYQDTLSLSFTSSLRDTAFLYRATRTCSGRAFVPFDIPYKKVILPKTVIKDSTLASCNKLKYTYRLQNSGNAFVHWQVAGQTVSADPAYQVDESMSDGAIRLKIYANGCVDSIDIDHHPLKPHVPNLVTQNGDGLNDSFKPLHLPPACNMTLFNRWGNRIAPTQPANIPYVFDNQPPGTYFFLIEDPTAGNCKGWVEVVK